MSLAAIEAEMALPQQHSALGKQLAAGGGRVAPARTLWAASPSKI
jgi:hypothetical protein